MMEKFDFEKLEVYQKALDFTDKIYDIFEKMPYRHQKSIGDNLIRAAVSVASNIAEGSARRGSKEKRQFFIIAQGSAFECIPSITLLCRRKIITEETFKAIYEDCRTISRMLSGLITHFSK